MTTVMWRVQWYSRPHVDVPEEPMGRHDFNSKQEAVAYYWSDEVQPLLSEYWRAEVQALTTSTLLNSDYQTAEVAR